MIFKLFRILNFVFIFKVHISAKGIKIVAPSLKYESRDVALQIPLKEVVRILVHFGKGLPVIFLYTMQKTGMFISRALDMEEASGTFCTRLILMAYCLSSYIN